MGKTGTPICVPSFGSNQLSVGGLKPEESEVLRASMLGGHHWVRRGDNGRLQSLPSFEPLPEPVTDEDMLPFWWKPSEDEVELANIFGFDASTEASMKNRCPSIYISSLCGYHYSAENYKREAEKLTSWGFVCMRSRRNNSGQYHEFWCLPGVYFAKGRLEESIVQGNFKTSEDKFKHALEFLRCNSIFGILDVSVQRIAMVID